MKDDDRDVSRDDRAIKSGVRLIGEAATRNGCAQFALVSTRCGVNSIFDTMEMRLKWIVKSRGYNLWGKKGNSIRPFRDLSLPLIQLDYAAPPTDRPCPQDSRVEGYRTPFRFDLVSPQRETCTLENFTTSGRGNRRRVRKFYSMLCSPPKCAETAAAVEK